VAEPLAVRAYHLARGALPEDAASVETLRAAARDAERLRSPREALVHLTAALSLTPPGDPERMELLDEIGWQAGIASDHVTGIAALRELAELLSDPEVAAAAGAPVPASAASPCPPAHLEVAYPRAGDTYLVAGGKIVASAGPLIDEEGATIVSADGTLPYSVHFCNVEELTVTVSLDGQPEPVNMTATHSSLGCGHGDATGSFAVGPPVNPISIQTSTDVVVDGRFSVTAITCEGLLLRHTIKVKYSGPPGGGR
jgi:hypothetical protein